MIISILYFATCSSLLLVVNKVAVYLVAAPTALLFAQLLFSAIAVLGAKAMGWVEADDFTFDKAKHFIIVVLGFLGCLYSNIKVLQNANVETFITFRSSTPLIMSLLDSVFLGRELPSASNWGWLALLLTGSAGYVYYDSSFQIKAYIWLALWYGFFVFEGTFVKHICNTVDMTAWGRVYYTNLMASVPLGLIMFFMNDARVLHQYLEPWNMLALLATCVLGLGMSHASYLLRAQVSATYFTVIGIVCKLLTVLVNFLVWDKHAGPAGIACLLVCVLAGSFYKQAPMRADKQPKEELLVIPSVSTKNVPAESDKELESKPLLAHDENGYTEDGTETQGQKPKTEV